MADGSSNYDYLFKVSLQDLGPEAELMGVGCANW